MLLHDPTSTRTDPEYIQQALEVLRPVVSDSEWSAKQFELGAAGP